MKVTVIFLSFIGLALFDGAIGKPSRGKNENFGVDILEKGVEYRQDVDLDDDGNTVTVHVPKHLDVDETYFITDRKKHLTMRLFPQRRLCLFAQNDPDELPSADVWRQNKDILIDDAESKKHMTSYMVSRALTKTEAGELPAKMQDVCKGVPKMWIDPIPESSEETQDIAQVPKLTTYINYTSPEGGRVKRWADSIDCCRSDQTAQKCVVYENSCYHVLSCGSQRDVRGRDSSVCTKKRHIYEDVRCCQPCCLQNVPEWNPTPSCSAVISKEQICPCYDFV